MNETVMSFPLERKHYPGENIFPDISLEFITHNNELIPVRHEIITANLSRSIWNVIVGPGRIWHEADDGEWDRASFPLSLVDSYVGRVHNCVATFTYQTASISNIYVQCSQETADLNDKQIGNIRIMIQGEYQPKSYSDSLLLIAERNYIKSRRIPVNPLFLIDKGRKIAHYFDRPLHTNAPTSLGAIILNDTIYLHPPKTRHGLYPYPHEMRHGVYSVTKSMAGALALFYFAERYGDEIFDAKITDYVAPLASHPAWQGVTFEHTLNMVTGTEGSEDAAHLYEILIKAKSAEEAIQNIATLGDAPSAPGERFNYASTNFFVLSYALLTTLC